MRINKLLKASALALTLMCGIITFNGGTAEAAAVEKTDVKEVYAKQNEVTMFSYTQNGKKVNTVKVTRKNSTFELTGKLKMLALQGNLQSVRVSSKGKKNVKVIKDANKKVTNNIYNGFIKEAGTYKTPVYIDASTKKKVLANVKQGTKLKVIGITKDKKWYKVQLGKKTGYVQVAKTDKTVADSMFIRQEEVIRSMWTGTEDKDVVIKSDATKNSKTIAMVGANTQLQVTHYCENNWVKVVTREGISGYVPLSELFAYNDESGTLRWEKAKACKISATYETNDLASDVFSAGIMPRFREW